MENFSKYFDLEEFLESSTARQRSIQNCPSWAVVLRLRELAQFLDGLREAWGSGIRVTSGFRDANLNYYVGGVPNSVHRIGFAADLVPVNGKMKEFKKFVVEWLKGKQFDEAIIEKNSKGSEWIHIQLYSPNGYQRKKVFSLNAA